MMTRYSRQQTPATFDGDSQDRLARARVTVVGAGGLGSPVLTYLASAGVGHIKIVDGDVVEESNLNRQFLHSTADIGELKAASAARQVHSLNPEISVDSVPDRLTYRNVDRILSGMDVVIDASDNFPTRTLIGRWTETHDVDVVWGVIYGMSGYSGSAMGGRGSRFHRLFPAPASAATVDLPAAAGVVGAACGVIGSIMAMEVIHRIARGPRASPDRLTHYDGGSGAVSLLEPAQRGYPTAPG